MTTLPPLAERICKCGSDSVTRLDRTGAEALLAELDAGWALNEPATVLSRRHEVKGFARAVYFSNMVAFTADRLGHHPDISFGFGYCSVHYTTHDVDGLSENDFISAATLDRLSR